MQEGRGEMSHDFDYEFLTNQSITDTSYVDDQGDLNRVVIVPDDQAKIYVPDYKKIISNDITDQLKRNPQIRMVNEYLVQTNFICWMRPAQKKIHITAVI